MFGIKSKHSYVELFEGIIIGSSLAAAATFIFGTKKGKELQKGLVHQYKKLGYTTKQMKQKLEKIIKTKAAKNKRKVKTTTKKLLQKTKNKKSDRKAA